MGKLEEVPLDHVRAFPPLDVNIPIPLPWAEICLFLIINNVTKFFLNHLTSKISLCFKMHIYTKKETFLPLREKSSKNTFPIFKDSEFYYLGLFNYKHKLKGEGKVLRLCWWGVPLTISLLPTHTSPWPSSLSQKFLALRTIFGFPGGANGKEPACQCRRRKRGGFHLCVGKIPWTKALQPTPGLLPGEPQG